MNILNNIFNLSKTSSANANRSSFSSYLPLLKKKWKEVPAGLQLRLFNNELLNYKRDKFIKTWEALYSENCFGKGFSVRGWYHELYAPLARQGGKWLEIGSGLGYDGTYFAKNGAKVTFCDIVKENLQIIERICEAKKIKNVDFKVLNKLSEIKKYPMFDVVLAIGSLINNPFEIAKKERGEFYKKLKNNGRWLELAYPKERWIEDGKLSPQKWAKKTDGERTPWIEWYDLEKLFKCFPADSYLTVLNFNFYKNEFNWFDLLKKEPQVGNSKSQS